MYPYPYQFHDTHTSKVKITAKKREAMEAAASPDDWQTLKKHQPYT